MTKNKASLTTKEAFEMDHTAKKQKFIDAIGGLDFERTPLNPVYTDSLSG